MLPLFAIKTSTAAYMSLTPRSERIDRIYAYKRESYIYSDAVCSFLKVYPSNKRTDIQYVIESKPCNLEDGLWFDIICSGSESDTTTPLVEYFFTWATIAGSQLVPEIPSREIISTKYVDLLEAAKCVKLFEESSSRNLSGRTFHDPLIDIDNSLPVLQDQSTKYPPEIWDYSHLCATQSANYVYNNGVDCMLECINVKLSDKSTSSTRHSLHSTLGIVSAETAFQPFEQRISSLELPLFTSELERRQDVVLAVSEGVAQKYPEEVSSAAWWEVLEVDFQCNTDRTVGAENAYEMLTSISVSSNGTCDSKDGGTHVRKKLFSALDWMQREILPLEQMRMLSFPPRQQELASMTGKSSSVERLIDLNSPWTFMPIRVDKGKQDLVRIAVQQELRSIPGLLELAPMAIQAMTTRKVRPFRPYNLVENIVQCLCADSISSTERDAADSLNVFVQTATEPPVPPPVVPLNFECGQSSKQAVSRPGQLHPVAATTLQSVTSHKDLAQHMAVSVAAPEKTTEQVLVPLLTQVNTEREVLNKEQPEQLEQHERPEFLLQLEEHVYNRGREDGFQDVGTPSETADQHGQTHESEPAAPAFEFAFPSAPCENMVEQYLRLQQSSSQTNTAPGRRSVTPQRLNPQQSAWAMQQQQDVSAQHQSSSPLQPSAVVQVTPERAAAEQVQRRVTQLAAHNISPFHAGDTPLVLLTSEAFLERYCRSVDPDAHGIELLDAPLQEPLGLIIDASTAICLLEDGQLVSKPDLKNFVKALSEVTFKFSQIFVVVMLATHDAELAPPTSAVNSAMLTLCQTTSRFPAAVCIRQCSHSGDNLTQLIAQLCAQTRRDALRSESAHSHHTTSAEAKYSHRPFLAHLLQADARYLAHCEFLQFFPTVNYYVAALLLFHHPLRELTGQRTRSLWDLLGTHYLLPDQLKECIKSFVALLEVHAGLTMMERNL